MATWDDVTALKRLSLSLLSGSTTTPVIYANGRHQEGVSIYLEAVGGANDNTTIALTADEVSKHIELVNGADGTELPKGWTWSAIKNEYHSSAPSSVFYAADSGVHVTLYVTYDGSGTQGNTSIAVRANLTNTKALYKVASTHKTGSNMGASIVEIHSKQAINYSDPHNLVVEESEWEILRSNVNWVSQWSSTHKSHDDAKLLRKVVTIKSKQPDHKFILEGIGEGTIHDRNTSPQQVSFYNDSHQGFTCLGNASHVLAVIARGCGRSDHQTNFWFSGLDGEPININGYYMLKDCNSTSNYYYRVWVSDFQDYPTYHNENITLGVYKIKVDASGMDNVGQWGWDDAIGSTDQNAPFVADVFDIYGNHGKVRVTFDADNYFDTPKLLTS